MLTMYLCFLAGGVVLPFLSFALGFLADGIGADVDVDADIGTDFGADGGPDIVDTPQVTIESGHMISIGLLPTSFHALSAFAIIFGAVGAVMTLKSIPTIITLPVGLVSGYLVAVLAQTVLQTLKKIQTKNYAVDENELLLYEGVVVDTILPGQLGTVSFLTLEEIRVSYPAICSDETLKLETGKQVKVIEKREGVFIVEPKHKYEQ
ncbi:MAG: hypothetical protein QM644_19425 [Mobilitalea sp.]